MLQIIINSDNYINLNEDKIEALSQIVGDRLGRFKERLTRVVAHIADENAGKGGQDDIRCMLEARPEGMDTLNVTAHASDVNAAVRAACDKLERLLDDTFARLRDR